MVTRKTQYGWMAMGGLICLFAVGLACKLRDGNKAVAQNDKGSDVVGPALSDPPSPGTASGLEPVVDNAKPLPPLSGPKLDAPPSGVKLEPPDAMPPGSTLVPVGFKEMVSGKPEAKPEEIKKPKDAVPYRPGGETDTKELSTPPTAAPLEPKVSTPEAAPVPPPVPGPMPSKADVAPEVKPSVKALGSPPPPPPLLQETGVKPAKAEKETSDLPGEPPLAPTPGIVQTYQVRGKGETLKEIAQRTMGSAERWSDIRKLNPMLDPKETLAAGTTVRLPGDACIPTEDGEPVKPLPLLRKAPTAKAKAVLPLTGTFPVNLDDKKAMTLPRAIRDQLAGCDTVMVSPGPDQCLWLTNQAHLERLATRLDHSPAREADVRVFKRLYYAQTEKAPLNAEGRVTISERLAQFAGLHQEVVLVGIDDHFEVWDAAKWREYTKQKSSGKSADAE